MSDRVKGMKAQLLTMVQQNRVLADSLPAERPTDEAKAALFDEEHKKLSAGITAAKMLRDRIGDLEFLESAEAELSEPEGKRRSWDGGNDRKAVAPRNRWGSVKNFNRDTKREANQAAYEFGLWFAACFGGESDFAGKARQYCLDSGLTLRTETGAEVKTMKEGINTTGGFIVPPEFDADLIDLREKYGVFRRNARIVPMTRDTKSIGRRSSGLTAYFVGEATAPTESEKAWDLVTLTARKLMTLTRVSSELNEDIIIQLGDDLAGEIAYAFALKEDECGFNGDGTSTYGGINGLRNRLLGVYGTSGGAGLKVASGNLFSEFALPDFNDVVGKLPAYADDRAKWFCHKYFYATVMQRLELAAGGVTAKEIQDGARRPTFLGYPVEVVQRMPKTDANSQIPCVFGDLRLSSRFGDRRQTVISVTEHRYFDTDEIGVKGSERFDIVNHDVGDGSDAGPVVGIISAAS